MSILAGQPLIEAALGLVIAFLIGCVVGSGAKRLARRRTTPHPETAASEPSAGKRAEPPTAGGVGAATAKGSKEDLKAIKGIGPKLESMLKAKGVASPRQIAEWSQADARRIDEELALHGRVLRDDWIGQARALLA